MCGLTTMFWQLVMFVVVCVACTQVMGMSVYGLEPRTYSDYHPLEQIQLRERKSNNLRNMMRIGRRSEGPVVPGFQMRPAPADYSQFFRPNAIF